MIIILNVCMLMNIVKFVHKIKLKDTIIAGVQQDAGKQYAQ